MEQAKPEQPSDSEGAEVNVEDTLVLIEKAKSAVLDNLSKIRLKFLNYSNDLNRLGGEDDYAEALLFVLKNAINCSVMLATIAPMFPDISKLKAAREKLRTAGFLKESKKNTSVMLELVAAGK